MRTITANGAIPRNDVGELGSWLGAKLHRIRSAWAARSRPAKKDVSTDQTNFVQADVAAFVSTFMRIG